MERREARQLAARVAVAPVVVARLAAARVAVAASAFLQCLALRTVLPHALPPEARATDSPNETNETDESAVKG